MITNLKKVCLMNESKIVLCVLCGIIILFSAGCNSYNSLYGQDNTSIDNISNEVDKAISEILPEENNELPPETIPGQESCNKAGSDKRLSLDDAKEIALDSECAVDGNLELTDEQSCNEVTGTWWLGLDITQEGCNPACVVNTETKKAEINWRCTGLNAPGTETDEPQCGDGLDNDNDGFTDYTDDLDCDSTLDDSEAEAGEAKTETSQSTNEESVIVSVMETELVDLQPSADDPDNDRLAFTFSNPLDKDGMWQTNYGDSGEYTVTVTVSDGQLTSSKDVLIIVKKKEEKPVITSFSPKEASISIRETESVSFEVMASDLNKDQITYTWNLDGKEVGEGNDYDLKATYDDSGKHTVTAEVTDGTSEASQSWSVDIANVNRKPVLERISPITLKETETVTIVPTASDPDNDELEITISAPVGGTGVWQTTYDDAGEYTVKVTVSDGTDSVSQDVKVTVENVNRPPVITEIKQRS